MPPTPSPTPDRYSAWNPYVIGPIIVVCSFILLFGYCKFLNRICCAPLSTLSSARHPVQMRRINESNFQDPSLEYHSNGLESNIMHSLPISQFKNKKDAEHKESDNECAVCLGEFEEGEWLKHLPNCVHVFHIACIDTWFQTHSNCPLCRTQVYDPSLESYISMNTLLETLRREDFLHGGDSITR
ncbi:RING-H2 finger protein ATL16-like [Mercurialis annua]|uniref:RING-H2 finger protein ATL16-like n=1 Tax=Mercurialis annua TaxID=3986 RepID=UPI00215E7460|nr:RING-H2 finger protein ATL16-like [Mercurialis annua]